MSRVLHLRMARVGGGRAGVRERLCSISCTLPPRARPRASLPPSLREAPLSTPALTLICPRPRPHARPHFRPCPTQVNLDLTYLLGPSSPSSSSLSSGDAAGLASSGVGVSANR